jgi:hypothetical protein
MEALPYTSAARAEWDAFVERSNNGTFLFQRQYMEYHADRFQDASLIIRDGKGRTAALFPASVKDGIVTSHAGLTYGGVVTPDSVLALSMLEVGEAVGRHYTDLGITRIRYKTVPRIYYRQQTDEDQYLLFRAGAALCRRDVLTVVEPHLRVPYEERRRRGVKRASAAGVVVRESHDLAAYWELLGENLSSRHGVQPVHTLHEMEHLREHFPANIRLFGSFLAEELMAGVVMYETERVAHVQYIASSPAGREARALDLLFHTLISETYAGKRYFDFGISTEQDGRRLNEGLVAQKEGFGGRTVIHDHYDWTLKP